MLLSYVWEITGTGNNYPNSVNSHDKAYASEHRQLAV